MTTQQKIVHWGFNGYHHVQEGEYKNNGYPVVRSYSWRTINLSDNPQAQEKINEFFVWLVDNGLMEISDLPQAPQASPMWMKYMAPNIPINTDVEPLEENQMEPTITGKPNRNKKIVSVPKSPTVVQTGKRKPGRPPGSKNKNSSITKSYVSTGRPVGRPRKIMS